MNKLYSQVKKLWVEALRSNSYLQGRDRLRALTAESDRFCCLGVLCDLYRKSKDNTDNLQWESNSNPEGAMSFDRVTGSLPPIVAIWAGSNSINMSVYKPALRDEYKKKFGKTCGINLNDFGFTSLAELNDFGFTFKEIAEIIEEHF